MAKDSFKIICQNKKARHEYHIQDSIEAGIVLLGPEVKSIREGRINIKDGYVEIKDGEAWLQNVHISPYPYATNTARPDPLRPRKLLLHKRQIKRLAGKVKERGFTLIPLRVYLSRGKVKVEIALAKGKKIYDRREALKRKTFEREFEKRFKIKR